MKARTAAVERQLVVDRKRQRQVGGETSAEQPVAPAAARGRRRGATAACSRSAAGAPAGARLAPSASRMAISAAALVGARQQQVGDVGAGDQQHDADDGHQDRSRSARPARRPGRCGFSRASSSGTAPALRPLLSFGKACSSCAKTVLQVGARLLDARRPASAGRTRTGTGRGAARTSRSSAARRRASTSAPRPTGRRRAACR